MPVSDAGPATRSSTLSSLGLISIVIPVYNEASTVGQDLSAIFDAMDAAGCDYEVLVVNDGSTDGTAGVLAQFPRIRLVAHPENRGVGAARTAGMLLAQGVIVVTTDGDGTYPNWEMPRLLARMADQDMVVGARVNEAGSWPWLRALAKATFRLLAGYMCGRRIPDLNSGLRCFRKDLARPFVPLLPSGHSWESTITMAFLTAGHRVAFEPVAYYPRRGGRSTFRPVRDSLSLLVRTVTYFRPLRFYLPVALGLLVLALSAGALSTGPADPAASPGVLMVVFALLVMAAGGLAEARARVRRALPAPARMWERVDGS
ncbi:MAG: glycosyltransferase family 2 protein [Chloroflexota bacterium]